MSEVRQRIGRYGAPAVALLLMSVIYGFARLPQLPASERDAMTARFRFTELPLVDELEASDRVKTVREVNPSLEHIAGWISAVGGALALNDLDGDGLSNDICRVETRVNEILVAPAPGTGQRYEPIVLSAAPLPYMSETTAPMGCLPADLNEDGALDLVAYYWGRTPIGFVRNEHGYVPVELVEGSERWYTNSATVADLDGDGHLDLLFANYFPDGARILDGAAREPDHMQDSMSRAFNGGSKHFLLWQPVPDASTLVRFVPAQGVLLPEHDKAWTLAVGAADLNNDMLPDLYFANDFGPDRFFQNISTPGKLKFKLLEGRRRFTTPGSRVLGRDSFKGMGVDFADTNGDGLLDMFVSNIAAEYALEESHFLFESTGRLEDMNEGRAPYEDHSEELGVSRSSWGWDAKFADFDNDGAVEIVQATGFLKGQTDRWPELQELALGNDQFVARPGAWFKAVPGDDLSGHAHNPFFVRARDDRFYDIALEIGLDQRDVSRGIATGDVDGDGDIDLAIANQWEASRFYRNDCRNCGASLTLRLLRANSAEEYSDVVRMPGHPTLRMAPAVGTSVTVTRGDGKKMIAQVDGGNGHSGRRGPELHFGLGEIDGSEPLTLAIRWRDAHGEIHEKKLATEAGFHTIILPN